MNKYRWSLTCMLVMIVLPSGVMIHADGQDKEDIKGQIAFLSRREEVREVEIYVMNTDGTNIRRLTNSEGVSSFKWSPDEKRVIFVSPIETHPLGAPLPCSDIYIINADGSGQQRLSNNQLDNNSPSWSPGGDKLAFASGTGFRYKIWVMDADGTHQKCLEDADGNSPVWSPDGMRIAFTSRISGGNANHAIYTICADGSGKRKLSNDDDLDSWGPRWSPDGKRIAYVCKKEIWVMDADGTGQKELTNIDSWVDAPAWSPAGGKIAFAASIKDNRGYSKYQIYVMDPDGSNLKNLTGNETFNRFFSWSPDGKRIVFSSNNTNGNHDIYIMKADGSKMKNLTDDKAWDISPIWISSQH